MTTRVLLLTSWYFPHKILRWQDAVTMIFLGKADCIVDYSEEIASPSTKMKMPAVIRLRKSISPRKKAVKFSRINVYTRDGFRCQYCGDKFAASKLTYDHVIPKSRGGRTEWTNIVTCCYSCNSKKDYHTSDESGMFPLTRPVRPKSLPLTPPRIDPERVPEEWEPFCAVLASTYGLR